MRKISLSRPDDEELDAKDEKRSERKERKSVTPPKEKEKKDPYRWLSLLLFFIVLFISYVFWVQGTGR
jgi:hypothetical protein